jgi:hypothetical protein
MVAETVLAFVVGFVVPVGVWTLAWFLPVPRTWWTLAILAAVCLLPVVTGILGGRRLRRLIRRHTGDKRATRHPDPA